MQTTLLSRTPTLIMLAGCCALAAACQDTTGPARTKTASSVLEIAPADPSATETIRLTVEGNQPTTLIPVDPGDSVSGQDYDRIVGANVSVYRELRDSTAGGPTVVNDTYIGRAVTDTNGMVELRDVAAAYYRVDIQPPTGSRYAPASIGTVSFPGEATASVLVNLIPR